MIAACATHRIEDDPRWAALLARDPQADGRFVYSVRSTGVYCRPSCPARLARPENVRFHLTWEDAERAGFRACKRCTPNGPALARQHGAVISEVCRAIDAADEAPALAAMARQAGMSEFHFHRVFKSIVGLTPREYYKARRRRALQRALRSDASVTQAIYAAGYGSSARFYEEATQLLGMGPSAYRTGGTAQDILFAVGQCSLGAILVAASRCGVCAIALGDNPETLVHELQDQFPRANLVGGDAAFERLVARVVGHVEAPRLGLDLPLDVRGTAFQQRVWQALRQIPAGTTASYADIAQAIGAPRAVRAVARACASNPIALAIPCHRVIRRDGDPSGYRWGVERKRALLMREAAA